MPQLGNLVITTANGDKTYSPVDIDSKGVTTWADRSGGIAIGFPTCDVSSRTNSNKAKVRANMHCPTLETPSGTGEISTGFVPAPTLAYNRDFRCEFDLPTRTTLAERTEFLELVQGFVASAIMGSLVKDQERMY